jgi:hypothetical protein
MNSWTALVIYDAVVPTLGEKSIAYGTVTTYLCELQINPGDLIP